MLCLDTSGALFFKNLHTKQLYSSYDPIYNYQNYHRQHHSGVYAGLGNHQSYYNSQHPGGSGKRSGRTYSDIARVINPNPYVGVGARHYPNQPFYPQG